jgi:hypothetical protein
VLIEVSGIVRARSPSRKTGILPTGHNSKNEALASWSARLTILPVNGVSFS